MWQQNIFALQATTLRSRALFRTLCLLLASAPAALRAAIINVPADQPTIQAGINAANPGDTVLVAPGTYFENIDFKGKAITVTSSGGAATTTINGGSKGGVATVFFNNGETSTSILSRFTITGGGDTIFNGASDGGVYVGGGNSYTSGGAPIIQNNIITANYCHNIDVEFATPTILNNTISGVLQDPQGTQGESYCTFGSGVHLQGTPNYPAMKGPIVMGNTIENNLTGSGINIWAAQNALIMNNIIRNNISPDPGSAFTSANSVNTVLFQNLIYGNASGCGGALAFQDGGYVVSNPSILIANNTIVDNVSPKVGGVTNCTLIAQIYPGPYSYGADGPGSVVINNIISGSTSYPAVNCSWFSAPSLANQPTFENNILYNAGGPFFGPYCVDVSNQNNNIVADPQFVNPSTGDYHLKNSSPAIDHGQNSALQTILAMTGKTLSLDFDGNPRVQATNSTVCTIDMGAYEYPGTQSLCSTTETLQSSPNPSTLGQTVTFTAQLSSAKGVPTGSVQFTDGSTILGTASVSSTGVATINTSLLAVGSHTITATYQPTGIFPATTAPLIQVVNPYSTATTVTSSLNPAGHGQPITFTATVSSTISGSGTPAGTIQFTDGASLLATQTLTANGSSTASASFATSALGAGTHTITATYVPTGAFAASTASVTQTIIGLPTTTLLAAATPNPANALQPVTLSAAVSTGTATIATGTITFFDGTTTLGTANLDTTGHATFITSTLNAGTHTLHAVYSGDTSFATSTSNNIAETVTANPTFTTLSITPTPSQAFQFFTVNFSITSLTNVPFTPQSCNPTCTVTLNITGLPNNQNSTVSAPVLANGVSPFRYALAAGTYTFTATFNGSPAFASSTSTTVTQVVVPAATTLTLAASPTTANQNQSVAFTSVFTAPLSTESPTGAITFLDGATPIATTPFTGSPLSNTATITAATSTLAPGTHIITATYPGDPNSNFLPATSAPITVIINPNDYALSTPTSHPIIPTEHHLAIPVNLSSIGVFADQVTLACTGLPVWTTCTFDQNTLQLAAGGTATTNLTIDTSSVLRYARNQTPTRTASSIAFALTLPAGILGLFLTRRRKLPLRLTLFFLTTLAATLTLTGCTGMYPLSTPPGAYTFNITANGTTTNLSHFITISLTVNP